ncbi:MAG: DUF998 domain-containing protein [Planctomycetota bacterium]
MERTARLRFDGPMLLFLAIAVLGVGQFLIAIPYSIAAYPGGTRSDRTTTGYSWDQNWLSDLGCTEAWNGDDNQVAARYFNWSMIAFGSCMIVFFAGSLRASEESPGVAAWVTSISGGLSGVGLVLLGCTPFDRYEAMHLFALGVWIVAMMIASCSFSVQVFIRGGSTSLVFPIATLVLIVGVISYGLSSGTGNVMLMQKICVGISLCWLLMVLWRIALTAIYIIVDSKTRYQIANEQATDYMRKIRSGHLVKRKAK